ncbi:hypothetical protein AMATHDRAFT_57590 [Amanita thiersii Skay4041]|uniref:adenosylmethionine decarboxylase n=1 Tax=Amanita thiersii Skay4041 TaxID=703135 RepID=A0A2A9NN62_9AGAR|nr:hypothetical protein AMATHDRAFT_57590 [Amanita thiersii Skay4041]
MVDAVYPTPSPFEGPEKLLEVWFAPSSVAVNDVPDNHGKSGLRKIHRKYWEQVLDIVKCKILSVIEGQELDAYLLSESSLFISPHRLILKTCGTTLNLLGLPLILHIAATYANLPHVYRCFYSRKAFMFPDRQHGPHRDWKEEVQFLDNIFPNGAAYTVGKVNGDHWLLYLTNPTDISSSTDSLHQPTPSLPEQVEGYPDYTIEILMSSLSPAACEPFFTPTANDTKLDPFTCANAVSNNIGISTIFPSHLTTLDAYAFTPCGYSANALIRWNDISLDSSLPTLIACKQSGEGYYTIHVTPEADWSYASFECNVPLFFAPSSKTNSPALFIPDIQSLVQRVVAIFKPGRITLTLFISSRNKEILGSCNDEVPNQSRVEAAQHAFRLALTSESSPAALGGKAYKRTDKINYEFSDYDLAFASFEAVS